MAMIELEKLCKVYRVRGRTVAVGLDHVSCVFEAGHSYAIMGASGSGKTTLLNTIAGLLIPTSGRCIVMGVEITAMTDRKRCALRNRHIGLVVQDFALLEDETALCNCMLPAMMAGMSRKEASMRACSLLQVLSMAQFGSMPVRMLSGGERQRVAIARAMMNQPSILLADEPTGALDSANAAAVMRTLAGLQGKTNTLIVVTHNPESAAYCEQTIVLRDGQIAQEQPCSAHADTE